MADALAFDIVGRDKLSSALNSASRTLEKLERKLDKLDHKTATPQVKVKVDKQLDQLESKFGRTVGNLVGNFSMGVGNMVAGLAKSGPLFAAVFAGIAATAVVLLGQVGVLASGAIVAGLGAGLTAIPIIFAAQSDAVARIWSQTLDRMGEQVRLISAPFEPVLARIAERFEGLFRFFKPALSAAFEALAPVVNTFAGHVADAFRKLRPTIGPIVDAFSEIISDLGPRLPFIFDRIADAVNRLAGFLQANPRLFGDLFEGLANLIPKALDFIRVLGELQREYDEFALSAGKIVPFSDLADGMRGARDQIAQTIDMAKELGLTQKELIQAAIDPTSKAYQQVNATLQSYTRRAGGAMGATAGLSGAQAAHAGTARAVRDALKSQDEWTKRAWQEKARDAGVTTEAAAANERLANKLARAAEKARDQELALERLIAKFTAFTNQAINASEAELDYQEAVDAARESIKEHGATLDKNTEKGRANRRALNRIAQTTSELIRIKAEHGATEKELHRIQDRGIVQFARTAEAAGLTSAAVDKLTKKYFGIPASVLTKLRADKRDAQEKIADVVRRLKDPDLTKDRIAHLLARKEQLERVADEAQARIDRLHGKTISIRINTYETVHTSVTFDDAGTPFLNRGTRAAGGPVVKGGTYLVGEKGPELFVPKNSGQIIPNHELQSTGSAVTGGGNGGEFTGQLYLDSGQFIGMVRGQIDEDNRSTRRRAMAGAS